MQRRTFKLILLVGALSLFGCSKVEKTPADYSAGVFAWERGWKYPVDNLPSNMRLASATLGALKVQEGPQTYALPAESKPWSSWWYPTKEQLLFEGANSPLQKFDRLRTQILKKESRVAAKAKSRWSPHLTSWEGLCDAWALASIYEFEPRQSLKIGDTCLTPGDQRALLISSYKAQGGDLKNNFFGQLNRNGPNDIFADIYPDQLHRIILSQLRDRKSPFLMDSDAGAEVWTVPVYEASVIVKRTEAPDTVNVELILTYPEFQFTPEDRLAGETKSFGNLFVKRQYKYNLYGAWNGNDFEVTGGEWTGVSENSHPDYAIILPQATDVLQKPLENSAEVVTYTDLVDLLGRGQPVSSCK